jgi:hypothetical protein
MKVPAWKKARMLWIGSSNTVKEKGLGCSNPGPSSLTYVGNFVFAERLDPLKIIARRDLWAAMQIRVDYQS